MVNPMGVREVVMGVVVVEGAKVVDGVLVGVLIAIPRVDLVSELAGRADPRLLLFTGTGI
jgi:hypothetical protein